MSIIRDNIAKLKTEIDSILKNKGEEGRAVTLVAAAKTVGPSEVLEAISAGVVDIGENRASELLKKYEEIGSRAKWHFIGHLQRNKVKKVIEAVDLIHSVDSVRLAEEIDYQASRAGKVQEILLQFDMMENEERFGFNPADLTQDLNKIALLGNIKVLGVMTMAPLTDDPAIARTVFRGLKTLFDRINLEGLLGSEIEIISMGMSQDFKIAIEEGSNMVRIGTGIFGQRGC